MFYNEKNKRKHAEKWAETRKIGKWKYIFLYGLLLGSGSYFALFTLITLLISDSIDIINVTINAVVFGGIYGLISWVVGEKGYKDYIQGE